MGKFTGPLGQRREPRRLGLLLERAELEAMVKKWEVEDDQNLDLLSDYYEVSRGDYFALCKALARNFVPCFQDSKKAGRKTKWSGWVAGVLVVEMERKIEKRNPARGIAWAAAQLAKQDPWSTFVGTRPEDGETANPAEVLRTQYMKSRRSKFVPILRDAFRKYQLQGDVAEWESLFLDLVRNPIVE